MNKLRWILVQFYTCHRASAYERPHALRVTIIYPEARPPLSVFVSQSAIGVCALLSSHILPMSMYIYQNLLVLQLSGYYIP